MDVVTNLCNLVEKVYGISYLQAQNPQNFSLRRAEWIHIFKNLIFLNKNRGPPMANNFSPAPVEGQGDRELTGSGDACFNTSAG